MENLMKGFWEEEDGMGTVEIVLIIAVLVSIALIFRKQVIAFVSSNLESIFGQADASVTDGGSGS